MGGGITILNKKYFPWLILLLPNLIFADSNTFLEVLSSPIFLTVLLTLGLIFVVLEILTPGFGPFAILGLICFSLFFFASKHQTDDAMVALIIFVVGFILLVLEFFIPGFGLPGISGIILVFVGSSLSFGDMSTGITAITIAVIITGIVTYFAIKTGMKSPYLEKIQLNLDATAEKGYSTNEGKEELIGKVGIALTILRPAGTGLFDDEMIDVVTEGEFINKGEEIVIIYSLGAKTIVRRKKKL